MFITKSKKKSLYYNRSNSFLYANGIKIHFKAKDAETKPYLLCFGKIFKNVTIDNMKKPSLNTQISDSSADYNTTDLRDIVDIHKY